MNDQGLVNLQGALTFEKLARHLPDFVWNAFEPFLPPVVWCGNGRPPISNRDCLHGAIFILISGTPWKLMPACFPSYKTVRNRLRRWVGQEAFRQMWSACAWRYDLLRGINFDQLSIDGARKPSKKGAQRQAPIRPIEPRAARKS
jgi:transposase